MKESLKKAQQSHKKQLKLKGDIKAGDLIRAMNAKKETKHQIIAKVPNNRLSKLI